MAIGFTRREALLGSLLLSVTGPLAAQARALEQSIAWVKANPKQGDYAAPARAG